MWWVLSLIEVLSQTEEETYYYVEYTYVIIHVRLPVSVRG